MTDVRSCVFILGLLVRMNTNGEREQILLHKYIFTMN
jgi:hypothetical protein